MQLQHEIRNMLRAANPIPPDENTVEIESVEDGTIRFSFKISEVNAEDILRLQVYAGILGYVVTGYKYFPLPLTRRDDSGILVTLTHTSMRRNNE